MTTISKTYNYTTPKGSQVNFNVTATYGYEVVDKIVNLDGDKFTLKEGKCTSEVKIVASVNGLNIQGTNYSFCPAPQKYVALGYTRIFCKKVALTEQANKELDEVIKEAINEAKKDKTYTSYINGEKAKSVAFAEKKMAEGKVLPQAELAKKTRAYDNAFNEGAEGFNPYKEYITLEQYNEILSK